MSRTTCPSCGSANVVTEWKDHKFQYGPKPSTIVLVAHIPVRTCKDCQFEFRDHEAEVIIDGIVSAENSKCLKRT